MARARLVVGDQNSAEFDQLRATVNNLLVILGNVEASITAGCSAEDVLNAISAGVTAGIDNNPGAVADYVDSGLEIVGLKPTPTRLVRPGSAVGTQLVDL